MLENIPSIFSVLGVAVTTVASGVLFVVGALRVFELVRGFVAGAKSFDGTSDYTDLHGRTLYTKRHSDGKVMTPDGRFFDSEDDFDVWYFSDR